MIIDKGLTALLFVVLGSTTYSMYADQIEGDLQGAQSVASDMQTYQLETALELYHLDHGHYPLVFDDDLADELYADGKLKRSTVPFEYEYSTSRRGQSYFLSLDSSGFTYRD